MLVPPFLTHFPFFSINKQYQGSGRRHPRRHLLVGFGPGTNTEERGGKEGIRGDSSLPHGRCDEYSGRADYHYAPSSPAHVSPPLPRPRYSRGTISLSPHSLLTWFTDRDPSLFSISSVATPVIPPYPSKPVATPVCLDFPLSVHTRPGMLRLFSGWIRYPTVCSATPCDGSAGVEHPTSAPIIGPLPAGRYWSPTVMTVRLMHHLLYCCLTRAFCSTSVTRLMLIPYYPN